MPERSEWTTTPWTAIRRERVLYDDDAVLVLNKPAGLAVLGERHDTDLVRRAREAGEELHPVHRIDKVTSGVLLLAKDLRRHGDLTRQFNQRSVEKLYLAITRSRGLPDRGVIDLPLSEGRKGRIRVAAPRQQIQADEAEGRWSVRPSDVFDQVRSYPSVTTFAKVCEGEHHSLLVVRPITGRRHQIRVHLAWIGHPIEGDPLFDKPSGAGDFRRATRTCLHAWQLAFDAAWLADTSGGSPGGRSRGGRRLRLEAVPDDAFWAPLRQELSGLADRTAEQFLDSAREATAQLARPS